MNIRFTKVVSIIVMYLTSVAMAAEVTLSEKLTITSTLLEFSGQQVRINNEMASISHRCISEELSKNVKIQKWNGSSKVWINKIVSCERILRILWQEPIESVYLEAKYSLALANAELSYPDFGNFLQDVFVRQKFIKKAVLANPTESPSRDWLSDIGLEIPGVVLTEHQQKIVFERFSSWLQNQCYLFKEKSFIQIFGAENYNLDCARMRLMKTSSRGPLTVEADFGRAFSQFSFGALVQWKSTLLQNYYQLTGDSPQLLFLDDKSIGLLKKKLNNTLSDDEQLQISKSLDTFRAFMETQTQKYFRRLSELKIAPVNTDTYEEHLRLLSSESFFVGSLTSLVKSEEAATVAAIFDDLKSLKKHEKRVQNLITGGVLLSCFIPVKRIYTVFKIVKSIAVAEKISLAKDILCLPGFVAMNGYFLASSFYKLRQDMAASIGFSAKEAPMSFANLQKEAAELSWMSLLF